MLAHTVFHAQPKSPLELYKELITNPRTALVLNAARAAGLFEATKEFQQAVSTTNKAQFDSKLGDPAVLHEEANQKREAALEGLVHTTLTVKDAQSQTSFVTINREMAEALFSASALIEKSLDVEKEYELQKVEGRYGLPERVFIQNALRDPMVKLGSQSYAYNYSDFMNDLNPETDNAFEATQASIAEIRKRVSEMARHNGADLDQRLIDRMPYIGLVDATIQQQSLGKTR